MSLFSSLTLIITVIIVYSFLFEIYSVLFRITGISKEKSKFQVISLLTNAGYTTSESEIITRDKTRRKLAKAAMLTGYFFSVIFVSLVINLFLSIDFTRLNSNLITLLIGFCILVSFFLIMSIPAVKKKIDEEIDYFTVKVFKHAAKENFISVIDSYGTDDAVCKVFIYRVPKQFEGKKIIDANIKNIYNVNILLLERKGQIRYVSKDTIISNNDSLLVFGPLNSIKKAFLLKEQPDSGEKKEVIKNRNEIAIMENYDYQVLAEIQLNVVPAILRDKSLVESRLKDYFSINVMMVSREGNLIKITKDTHLEKNDHVIAFGPYESIQTVFGEKECK